VHGIRNQQPAVATKFETIGGSNGLLRQYAGSGINDHADLATAAAAPAHDSEPTGEVWTAPGTLLKSRPIRSPVASACKDNWRRLARERL